LIGISPPSVEDLGIRERDLKWVPAIRAGSQESNRARISLVFVIFHLQSVERVNFNTIGIES